MQINQTSVISIYYRRKSDTASNCSISGISGPDPVVWECKVHSKKPEHFGTYLHPNYLNDAKESNTHWTWPWIKCSQFNKPNVAKGKLSKIRKRILKILKKINDRDHDAFGGNSIDDSQKTSNNDVEFCNSGDKIPSFTNLAGLKVMVLSTEFSSAAKR